MTLRSSDGGAAPGPDRARVKDQAPALTVLYDGSCPLCRREIAMYQGLAADQPLCFVDVSAPVAALPAGTDRPRLMARFHVQRANGELSSGAAAFVLVWQRLPGWRWLAAMARLPGVTPLMELAYRGFLPLRPALQKVLRAWETPQVPADLVGDLRSDHAGETGAVWIYRGILAVSRDPAVRAFAQRHGHTEAQHLEQVTALLPVLRRSLLLPGWRVAGFLTGALPALFGARAVYATIEAVETFVDAHYQAQIDRLSGRTDPVAEGLRAVLLSCQADEVDHRDEAAGLKGLPAGPVLRAWCRVVGAGSAAAVHLARRI